MIRVYSGGIAVTNSYVLQLQAGTLMVDAPEGVVDWLREQDLRPDVLFLTHQHFDHVWDAAAVVSAFGCPVYAWSPYSKDLTLEKLFSLHSGGGLAIPEFVVTEVLADRPTVQLAGIEWTLHHVPGHSPDSLCLHDPVSGRIFGGDVLFAGGIGRTDFPMSDPELMQASLSRLLELPGHLLVCSGHGPVTTLEQELRTNPFLDHVRRARGMAESHGSSELGPRWG